MVAMNGFRRWRQQRIRQVSRKIDSIAERGRVRQWFLLAGCANLAAPSVPDAAGLTPIYPPGEVFWADPFLCSAAGHHWVFFEEFDLANRRGHINAIELDAEARPCGETVTVLEESHHLSYPFLLEFGGDLYMIPEKAGTRRVDLYRCIAFPDRWEYVKTLIDGMALSDPTLFEHEGQWWLFCAARNGRLRVNESLLAFYAPVPLSDHWTPHQNNPLVLNFSRGRPGGRVFRDEMGRLFRPSQDCVRRYGYGLNLNEILVLSPAHFEERLIWHLSGDQAGGWHGLHHVDWHHGLVVMDAQRLVPASGTGPPML